MEEFSLFVQGYWNCLEFPYFKLFYRIILPRRENPNFLFRL